MLRHRYRLRVPGEGVAQQIPQAGSTSFFAVALAPDGTVWAGGEATRPGTIGALVQVAADGTTATPREPTPARRSTLQEARGRIEDITVDQRGRMHLLFLVRNGTTRALLVAAMWSWSRSIRTSSARRQIFLIRGIRCVISRGVPSASTRVVAADRGAVWLAGSDGGVVRVEDDFQNGQCPAGGWQCATLPSSGAGRVAC